MSETVRGLGIGMDLGGTRVKAGVVDGAGRIVARRVVAVGPDKSGEAVVARLAALVDELVEVAPGEIERVGLAAAGVLDRRAGIIRESPNFPGWRDLALGALLQAEIGRPVALDNDANAVIWGESQAGAGRGASSLIGLTLGTGVGGALVLDGELWRGSRGMAGELGHITVVPEGRPCGCGNRGCLEQYAGAVGIRQGLRQRGGALAALAEGDDAPLVAARLARGGDAGAQAVYAEAGDALGQAIAAYVHILDITPVVLAGGVAAAADLFMPALLASFKARTFRSMSEGVEILVGELGEDAGIVGAALGCAP